MRAFALVGSLVALLLVAMGPALAEDMVAASVPARPIKSGEIIAPDDLREGIVSERQLRPDSLLSADNLIGMQARRTLIPGRVVSALAVGHPYLVERNGRVAALYQDGVLRLRMSAKCMDNGIKGDTVRIINPGSGQVIDAIVTGTNEVVVPN